MEPLAPSSRRSSLLAVAIGLLVLLAVVALASRSGFARHSQEAAPSERYTSYALTAFLILFVLMIPVAIYSYSIRLREKASAPRKSFQARLLAYGLRFVVLFLIAYVSFTIRHQHPQLLQHFHPFGLGAMGGAGRHRNGHAQYNPTFQWSVLWVALVLLAAGGAYGYYRWRTRKPPFVPRETELTVAEDFAASIDDAIDDLESEPDARRAVIAAYARMEAALGRNGLQRERSETALEYLRRVLLGLTSRGEPVRRLTGLFEQAKFSDHAIDTGMKHDAIGALREIRADL
jgi:membrane protease YdiL (CAAX protease family)